jgi:hypothetical protein
MPFGLSPWPKTSIRISIYNGVGFAKTRLAQAITARMGKPMVLVSSYGFSAFRRLWRLGRLLVDIHQDRPFTLGRKAGGTHQASHGVDGRPIRP